MNFHKLLPQHIIESMLAHGASAYSTQTLHNPTLQDLTTRAQTLSDLQTILYHYISTFTISGEMVPVIRTLLTPADISRIQGISAYNFNKLKILFNAHDYHHAENGGHPV